MSARRRSIHLSLGALALLALFVIAVAPASAKVIHLSEGSFNGADAPGGPFGPLLISAGVDQSSGDVYVTEFESEAGVVDKFNANGEYAKVQIKGTKIPGQKTFSLGFFSGVAVDASAGATKGDVYVADSNHGVLDRFSEAGAFVCQITGKEPVSVEEKAHECNGAEGSATTECKEEPVGCSIAPAGVAVDTRGDVYVVDEAHGVIDRFGEAGEYLSRIKDPHLAGSIGSIAIDSQGNLYVRVEMSGGKVIKFDSEGSFSSVLDEGHEALGVGVDPTTDHVYVAQVEGSQGRDIAEYEPSGALLSVIATPEAAILDLAVDGASGRIYAPELPTGRVSIFGPDVAVPTVASSPATNVGETSATLNGHVDPDTAHAGLEVSTCVFEYGTSTAYGHTAPCSPPAPYTTATDVNADVTGLTRASTYHFRIKATSANGASESEDQTFTTAGAPVIDSAFARPNGSEAILRAQINPLHLDTTCQVQYVDDQSFQSSGYAKATTLACSPEDLGSGFGDVGVVATISGLKVATTYHYRFLASNKAGLTGSGDQTVTTFGADPVKFEVLDKEGLPFTQAAGHPYELLTSFQISQYLRPPPPEPGVIPEGPSGNVKDVVSELPAGLIGDPSATPKCTRHQVLYTQCPAAAQVGVLSVALEEEAKPEVVGVYNVVPPQGIASEFAADIHNGEVNAYIDARLRSGGDYGVTAESTNISALSGIKEVIVKLWGVPAEASHDAQRCARTIGESCGGSIPAGVPEKPFLRNPTACSGPLSTTLSFDSWQDPGQFDEHVIPMPEITGCPAVPFTPSLQVQPTTTAADSPTGLYVDLHIPYNTDPKGLGQSDLKDTTVVLPAGVSANPAAANGLQACSPAQVGLTSAPGATPVRFTPDPAQCPEAAKIGTVEVDTPLLDHPLPGAVYIATPYDNPFSSLLAIYIAIYDEQSGVVVKLAGHVEANPQTGQLTTTFSESPQVPFEDFKLDFFSGPRAALATPEGCGSYTTTGSLTPWSATGPVSLSEPFTISSHCVSGFSPTFSAGTANPQAGAYSPLVLSFARADTDQDISGLSVTLPPGLVGKLAGIPLCSEAQLAAAATKSGAEEAANPSCPAASLLGTVQAGSGAGADPLFLPGKAYLTGPYNGGPYGLAVIVPALAGPFDLGTVIVRSSLRIDPHTAQVTAVADPFPTVLKGIPIRLRRVDVNIDRAQFTLNPTSCNPSAAAATLSSTAGLSATVSQHFQAGGCQSLHFKPQFSASTQGATSKANGASLDVKVAQSPGEANIAKVDVSLPLALPSRLTTLQKACPGAQFDADPGSCPAGSLVGAATARTPLLSNPLGGPAYLVSHGNAAFPDLVVVLRGEGITIELTGHTNIKAGITYSRFDTVPDAPISSFELTLPRGPHSALAANANLCSTTRTVTVKKRVTRRIHGKRRRVLRSVKQKVAAPLLMPTTITAQNGAVIRQTTRIAVTGCAKAKQVTRSRTAARHTRGRHRRK
jgi:hypothetical protein